MKTPFLSLCLLVSSAALLPAATYVGSISRDNPIGRFGFGSSIQDGGLGTPIFATSEVTLELESGMVNITSYRVSLDQQLNINGLSGTFTDPVTFQQRQVTLNVQILSASLLSASMAPSALTSLPNGRLDIGPQNLSILENTVTGTFQLTSPGLTTISGSFSENIPNPVMRPAVIDGEIDVAGFPDSVTLFAQGAGLIIPPGPGFRVIDESIGGIPVTFDIRFLDILYDPSSQGRLLLVPEPSTAVLLGFAALGITARRRRAGN